LREGKSPAASLREAQISMWRQRRWHLPYYWAAFAIQGEYEGRFDFSRSGGNAAFPRLFGGAALAALLIFSSFLFARTIRRRKKRAS